MPLIGDSPNLYCGTYGKYNRGSIKGAWLNLEDYDDAEDFFKACAELHKDERDPEFMFQDFENFPKELYSESMGSEAIQVIIDYAKLDEGQRELVEAFMQASGEYFGAYTIEQIEDSLVFQAEDDFTSIEEQYGYYCVEEEYIDVPKRLRDYFDYKAYGEDMAQDCSEANGYLFDLTLI